MASTEIVVLHSSPPHQQRDKEPITTPPALQYVPNSSSSDGSSLPSVSKLWTKWDRGQRTMEAAGVSPSPHDARSKGGSQSSASLYNASLGFQNLKAMAESKELRNEAEVEVVEQVHEGGLEGGKRNSREVGNSKKPKKVRVTADKKSKAERDTGVEKELKTKAKRKSRAKVVAVDPRGTVSNHFGQKIKPETVEAPTIKPRAKRKPRTKPVTSIHFAHNDVPKDDLLETIEKEAVLATRKRKRKDADDSEKAPKPVSRTSEGEAKAPIPRERAGNASTHFTIDNGSKENQKETNIEAVANILEPHESMDLEDKRRISWTPVSDTAPAQLKSNRHDIYEVPSSSQPPTHVGPNSNFRSMVGSFGFDSRPVTRSVSPEKVDVVGLNKRRRIEPIDDTSLFPAEAITNAPAPFEPKGPAIKEIKKKSPKKAAFSITNKVIDKYAQPLEVTKKTSIFFAPRVETPVKTASPEKVATLVKTKKAPKARPKGSIKARASKNAVEGGQTVIKPKAKAKTTKPKKIVDSGQRLISPTGIARRAEQQIVMFGTSSQLLTGDSPNTLRQLREALRESEMMTSIEKEPACTAPVRRRLACGIRHTSGKLWAQQAESFDEDSADGEVLPSSTVFREPDVINFIEEQANSPDLLPGELAPADLLPFQCRDDGFQTLSDEIEAMDFDKELESSSSRRATAGGFMPTQPNFEEEQGSSWHEMSSAQALPKGSTSFTSKHSYLEERDFLNWHKFSSSQALPEDEPRTEPRPPLIVEQTASDWHTLSSMPPSPDDDDNVLDLRRSPSSVHRTIKLDPKRAAAAPAMRSSLFSSLSPSVSRAALRPLSTNTKPPKKSSSPLKATRESAASGSTDATGFAKKKRGRLAKAKPSEENVTLPLQPTPKRCKKKKDKSDDWHEINDAITDSEPDMTPSPRRRGKRVPPSPLPDLVSNPTQGTAKRFNGVLANANHPQWPEIQAKLFPDITLAVKGQIRSTSRQKLTWYQKMLMYDPIVIEDLCAFVNTEGLRITIKEKEEEVKGWMVQKWCEDNSVCCLWKEGLRGGVKTRY